MAKAAKAKATTAPSLRTARGSSSGKPQAAKPNLAPKAPSAKADLGPAVTTVEPVAASPVVPAVEASAKSEQPSAKPAKPSVARKSGKATAQEVSTVNA
jgi:hypothetical protein